MPSLDRLRLSRRIDACLSPWAGRHAPGMTVGVVEGGELVLHRSAGLASLELSVPIGAETCFRIASVSKQFTCAAALMLVEEARLGLDDRAAEHLPGLPDLGVTIRHLMHNTSGLRDMLEIMRQGGADLGTPVSPEALMEGISRQRTLNFPPGSAYLYSNTNFLLLGRIVEAIVGETLAAFLERRIFAPLGMTRTRLTERAGTPAPGLATGYLPDAEGGYVRAPHAFPLHGEGGLVSCVEDLAIWSRHLDTDGAGLAVRLAEPLAFPNGAANFYARGQTLRSWRGVATVSHGGLWPGYKTEFLRVPELATTVIAISNDGGADPNGLGLQVLDMLLDGRPGTPPAPQPPAELGARLSGRWVAPDRGATLDAAMEEGRPVLRANGVPLVPRLLADGWVGAAHGSTALAVRALGADRIEVEQSAGQRAEWHRAVPGALPEGLAGDYVSDEMAASWRVSGGGAAASVQASGPVIAAAEPWRVEPVEGELFRVWVPGTLFRAWLDVRAVIEDGRVSALLVSGGRARNVRYERAG